MNLKWRAVIVTLALATGMADSLAWAQGAPAQAAVSPASDGNMNAMTAPASTGDTTYVIGAEDVLHIAVWKETDLTATEPVRADGKISLPLLNDVQASGLTPMQLADSLTEKLKKFVADPRVTVVVTAINSKRIYLLGEVSHRRDADVTQHDRHASVGQRRHQSVRQHQEDLRTAQREREKGEVSGELSQADQG